MQITRDIDAWLEAGGDRRVLDALSLAGRIATFTDGRDRAFAGVHPARPAVGTLADWTGAPEVLAAAEAWLREVGCEEVLAPMHLCRWFPHRARRGDEGPAALRHEPPVAAGDWEGAGYALAESYVAVRCDHGPQIDAGTGAAARLALRGYRLAALGDRAEPPSEAVFDAVVARAHTLLGAVGAEGRGELPVPVEAVRAWYAPLRTHIDPRLVFAVDAPDGERVGFLLALPDDAVPERRWFQIVALVVAPAHDARGVGAWMVAAAHRAARRLGFSAGVHGPMRVREGRPEATTALHGDVVRRYGLYGKRL